MRKLTDTNPVARGLAWLARAIFRPPRGSSSTRSSSSVRRLCVFYTVTSPNSTCARTIWWAPNKKYHQNFLRFKKEFPTQDDLVVVVESETPEKNRQFVERLGAKLEAETNLFHDVLYKRDFKMLGSKALLFVPDNDLQTCSKTLRDYRPFIEQFSHTTNLVSLFSMINTQFRTAKREKNAENESLMKALPALERIVTQARDSLRRAGTPPSPGVTALFDPTDDAEQESISPLPTDASSCSPPRPRVEELNDAAVERLRNLVEQTSDRSARRQRRPDRANRCSDHDQMAQSKKDATLASIVSLFLCALIFIYGYQETGRPVKATLCLLFGLAYTLAFAFMPWPVGHLNILTITFVPILIGLAIDYGVHLISRYEEELRHGRSERRPWPRPWSSPAKASFTAPSPPPGPSWPWSSPTSKASRRWASSAAAACSSALSP